jgi:RimJ/RimL family protein N-acetyltransferase
MAWPALEELHTPRLLLVRMGAADLEDFCRMHRDPRVMATLGGIRSDDVTVAVFQRLVAHWEQHGFGWWTIRDLATGRFAGRGGLRHVIVGGREEVEIGYGLLPDFWGRGLATELATASAQSGFVTLGRQELVGFTLPTNLASRRVLEKAGFRYERDIVYAELPHVLYRLTATAWQALAHGSAEGRSER